LSIEVSLDPRHLLLQVFEQPLAINH
jgi:hypothetical protein